MGALNELLQTLPEEAKDLRLNLQSLLADGALSREQRLGTALACAYAVRSPQLARALLAEHSFGHSAEHSAGLSPAWQSDARAAAALMGMNNVFYRFRHLVGKESYASLPARLRMNRMAAVLTTMSLAVSAIGGCGVCVASHERALIEGGLSEAQVLEAVRLAAVVQGLGTALTMALAMD
jgi:alkyl hydroperoxide reductase subunit D